MSVISNLNQSINCGGKCDCCSNLQQQINELNQKLNAYIPRAEKRQIINESYQMSIMYFDPKILGIKGEIDLVRTAVQGIAILVTTLRVFLEQIKGGLDALIRFVQEKFPELQRYVNEEIRKLYDQINKQKQQDYNQQIAELRQLISQLQTKDVQHDQGIEGLRAQYEQLRQNLAFQLAAITSQLRGEIQQVRSQLESFVRGEIAGVKSNLQQVTSRLESQIKSVSNKADSASKKADSASKEALKASSLANTASREALKASSLANTASNKADSASKQALMASSLANTASKKADSASKEALKASSLANTASKQALKASQDARMAAAAAAAAADKAEVASSDARIAAAAAFTASNKADAVSREVQIISERITRVNAEIEKLDREIANVNNVVAKKDNMNTEVIARLDKITPIITSLPPLVGRIPDVTAGKIPGIITPLVPTVQEVGTEVDRRLCSNPCVIGSINSAAGNITRDIGGKIDKANSAGQTAMLTEILSRVGDKIPGGLSGKLVDGFKWLQLDRALNVLTFAATIHNAAQLSSDIATTLGSALSNVVALIGLKDDSGKSLDIGALINSSIQNAVKTIIGAENYTTLSNNWAKANRIYQAATNVLNTTLSLSQTVLQASELIAGYTGRIGNALKKGGVVLENAYTWMNPNPNFSNRVTRFLEGFQQTSSTIQMVTQAPLDIVNATTELTAASTELVKSIKEDKEENKGIKIEEPGKLKEDETKGRTDSKPATFDFSDLFDGEDYDDITQ